MNITKLLQKKMADLEDQEINLNLTIKLDQINLTNPEKDPENASNSVE